MVVIVAAAAGGRVVGAVAGGVVAVAVAARFPPLSSYPGRSAGSFPDQRLVIEPH